MYGKKIIAKEFKIGDKVVITNLFSERTYTITRLLKLHAVGELKTSDGRTITEKFKKEYRYEEGGRWYGVHPVPEIRWDRNTYKVIESE